MAHTDGVAWFVGEFSLLLSRGRPEMNFSGIVTSNVQIDKMFNITIPLGLILEMTVGHDKRLAIGVDGLLYLGDVPNWVIYDRPKGVTILRGVPISPEQLFEWYGVSADSIIIDAVSWLVQQKFERGHVPLRISFPPGAVELFLAELLLRYQPDALWFSLQSVIQQYAAEVQRSAAKLRGKYPVIAECLELMVNDHI